MIRRRKSLRSQFQTESLESRVLLSAKMAPGDQEISRCDTETQVASLDSGEQSGSSRIVFVGGWGMAQYQYG